MSDALQVMLESGKMPLERRDGDEDAPVVEAAREALLQETARVLELCRLVPVGEQLLVGLCARASDSVSLGSPPRRQDAGPRRRKRSTHLLGRLAQVTAHDVEEWQGPARREVARVDEPSVQGAVDVRERASQRRRAGTRWGRGRSERPDVRDGLVLLLVGKDGVDLAVELARRGVDGRLRARREGQLRVEGDEEGRRGGRTLRATRDQTWLVAMSAQGPSLGKVRLSWAA